MRHQKDGDCSCGASGSESDFYAAALSQLGNANGHAGSAGGLPHAVIDRIGASRRDQERYANGVFTPYTACNDLLLTDIASDLAYEARAIANGQRPTHMYTGGISNGVAVEAMGHRYLSQDTCHCCPVRLSIANVRPISEGIVRGHEYDLVIEARAIGAGRVETPCRLLFEEKIYYNKNSRAMPRQDITGLPRVKEVMDKLGCGGKVTLEVADRPRAGPGALIRFSDKDDRNYKRTVISIWTLIGFSDCKPKRLVVFQTLSGRDNAQGKFEWSDPPGSLGAIDWDLLDAIFNMIGRF